MINPFYNAYREKPDQLLSSELNKEAIQMLGFDVVYMNREYVQLDKLLGEDRNNIFKQGKLIEMYCSDVDGFRGAGELKSLFGDMWDASATFVVNKKRFADEFPSMPNGPQAGDLIYMPYAETILEIRYSNTDPHFVPQSITSYYELDVEIFKYSHEDFDVDLSAINDDYTKDSFSNTLDNFIIDTPETNVGDYGDNDIPQNDYSHRFKIEKNDNFKPKN